MAVTLTPPQEQALLAFEESAQLAATSKADSAQADADAIAADALSERNKVIAQDALAQAYADAQAFIDAMIPPEVREARALAMKGKK